MHRFIEWAKRDFNWSWVAAIVLIIIISYFIFFTGYRYLPEKLDASYYLLSAIGQALAAIFAVVLTISLLITQLTLRYTNRSLANAFSPLVVIYFILFVVAILYPFLLLNSTFTVLHMKISLLLITLCISLLVPYFLTFPSHQGIRRIIDMLSDKVRANILTKDHAFKEVEELINIASSSFSGGNYFIVELVTESLSHAIERPTQHAGAVWELGIMQLKQIAFAAIYDMQALDSKITPIIEILKRITVQSIYAQSKVHGKSYQLADKMGVSYSLMALNEIGNELARHKHDTLVQKMLSALVEIIPSAILDKSKDTMGMILSTALNVYREAAQNQLIQSVNFILCRFIQRFAQARSLHLIEPQVEEFFYDTLFRLENLNNAEYKSIDFQFEKACILSQIAKSRAEINDLLIQYQKWRENKQNIS